jgi:OOP family OmpA-OmpF porin
MLNKKHVLSTVVASLAGVLLATSASASGAYFGGQLGYGMTHQPGFTNTDVNNILAGSTSSSYTRSNLNAGLAGRIFGGYDITENFAAEVGYSKFRNTSAKFNGTVTYPIFGSVNYNLGESVKTYAVDVVGKATMPLQYGFSAFGKLGVAYLNQKGNVSVNGTNIGSQSEHKVLPTFGAGVAYAVTQNVSADLSWMRIQTVGSTTFMKSTDFVGLGLGYHFG